MNCPVCGERLREIERSGVLIDICPACKGCWLDRGELDKLLALDAQQAQVVPISRARSDSQSQEALATIATIVTTTTIITGNATVMMVEAGREAPGNAVVAPSSGKSSAVSGNRLQGGPSWLISAVSPKTSLPPPSLARATQ